MPDPATTRCPSVENSTEFTLPGKSVNRRSTFIEAASRISTEANRATASRLPSGESATAATGLFSDAAPAIFGTINVRRNGSLPSGPFAPDSIQAVSKAISSAVRRSSSSGGITGLALPVTN